MQVHKQYGLGGSKIFYPLTAPLSLPPLSLPPPLQPFCFCFMTKILSNLSPLELGIKKVAKVQSLFQTKINSELLHIPYICLHEGVFAMGNWM